MTLSFLESWDFQVSTPVKEALERFGGLVYECGDGDPPENFIIIPEDQLGEGVTEIILPRVGSRPENNIFKFLIFLILVELLICILNSGVKASFRMFGLN